MPFGKLLLIWLIVFTAAAATVGLIGHVGWPVVPAILTITLCARLYGVRK